MDPIYHLADVLTQYINRAGYTVGQLSRLSGIPKRTITNWWQGEVKKPRHCSDLLKIAAVLHLNEEETTRLLQSARYPSVATLLASTQSKSIQEALLPWADTVAQRLRQSPFQVIPDLACFVGRQFELQGIQEALLEKDGLRLVSLHGMGGVGKTALAVRTAYSLRHYFPDGVLWARVDTSDTMTTLYSFAAAYEQDVSRYTDLESRSRAVRELLAGKRTLIILDNVESSELAQPLLPPSTGNCAVMLTTRRHDLIVTHSAKRFHIGPFSTERQESFQLFASVLGEQRAQEEKSALNQIAELLGHLPLAVALIAYRLCFEPGWEASTFVDRLHQEHKRLDELATESLSVRLSFQLSYQALSANYQRFFGQLGAFGRGDFAVDAVAHVASLSLEEAFDNLRKLHNFSLVQKSHRNRYRLHPLLRDFALEQANQLEARTRLIDYFVNYARSHMTDFNMLEQESDNIIYALKLAFEIGYFSAAVHGTNAFFRFLAARGLYTTAESMLNAVRQKCKYENDRLERTRSLLFLGQIKDKQGNYESAERLFQEALASARNTNHTQTVIAILTSLGGLAGKRGNLTQAEFYLQEALILARQINDRRQIAGLLVSLGAAAENRGNYVRAETLLVEGLEIIPDTALHEKVT